MEKSEIKKEEKNKKENEEELKRQLEECQKIKEEYLNSWKRERADFLNYKKEEIKRMGEFMKFANQELLLKILEILDNMEIAEKKIPREWKENDWFKGFLLLKTQILDFLEKEGVKEIKILGEKFDPNFQEAVECGPAEKREIKEERVVEEIRKGYTLHGRVLRPTKVKVSR